MIVHILGDQVRIAHYPSGSMETRTATDVGSFVLTCGWKRRTALAGTKSFLRPGIIQPNARFRGFE